MNVVAAELAAKRGASLGAMMLGYLVAFRAEDAVRVEPFNELLKASCVVWIFALKLHQRVSGLRNTRTYWVIAVDLAHGRRSIAG